jgi:hypothetical protein
MEIDWGRLGCDGVSLGYFCPAQCHILEDMYVEKYGGGNLKPRRLIILFIVLKMYYNALIISFIVLKMYYNVLILLCLTFRNRASYI